jgi:hypothetical protein
LLLNVVVQKIQMNENLPNLATVCRHHVVLD